MSTHRDRSICKHVMIYSYKMINDVLQGNHCNVLFIVRSKRSNCKQELQLIWPLTNILSTTRTARKRPLLSADLGCSTASMFSKRRFVNVGDVEDIFAQLSDWRHKVNVAELTPEEMQIHRAHLTAIEVIMTTGIIIRIAMGPVFNMKLRFSIWIIVLGQ